MTQTPDRPGIDQLRNLADRVERHGGLTPDEATRLRDGIDALVTRTEKAELKAEAMTAAMQSTATDALKHRGCHMKLMAQCTRAEQAEDLLRVAHETSNRSESERAQAVQRAEQAEATLAAFRDQVQAITDEARGGIRQQLGDALAVLDRHGQTPA